MNNSNVSAIIEWWDNHNGLLMFFHARTFVERISWFGGNGLFSFPALVPMWYVRDLIVLIMLAPLIYWAAQRKIFLIIVLIIYVTGEYPFVPGLSPSPLLFFSTGVFLSLNGYNLIDTMCRYQYPAYAVFIILWIVLIPLAGYRTAEGNYFYPFFIISGVVSVINIISFYVKKEELANKSSRVLSFFRENEDKCFFIFAAHTLMLPYINGILNKTCHVITNYVDVSAITFADQYPMLMAVCYMAKMLIIIGLCMLCSCFLQRFFPEVSRLVTGR